MTRPPFRAFPRQPHGQGPCCRARLQGHQILDRNSRSLLFFSVTVTERHFLLVTSFPALEATSSVPQCVCTAFRLLGAGSGAACPREGTPSHVSQFGDVYRVGSEGGAGQMDFCPNKSELGLAWSSGHCGSRPGRG